MKLKMSELIYTVKFVKVDRVFDIYRLNVQKCPTLGL